MKIGILLNRVKFEEKQIILACKKHGIDIEQFNNQRMILNLGKAKDIEPAVDVFLQRALSHSRGLYSTAIIESKGYPMVNNFNCLHISGDKLLSSLLMGKEDIPTPETWVAFKPDYALKAAEEKIHFPVICKPIIGSWGRMVAKLNDPQAAQALFDAKDNLGDVFQKIYYLQEFVDSTSYNKDAPTDIRVFYLGGKCIAAMGRYRGEKDFRSNIAIGGTAKSYEITPKVEKLCNKIGKVFDGEILGIDLMETKDGYTCIEVNGTPGFEGLVKATGVNIGEEIVMYLKEKYS